MVRGPSPVPPRPAKPGPATRAHPVELTDVAPPEAAQEGAQGGWRLDRAAQGAGRPPGAQHIGVVNASRPQPAQTPPASSSCPQCSPAPALRRGQGDGRRVPRRPRLPRQGGRKEQPGIGHQAAVVEGDLDPVGGGCVAASTGCSFSGAVFLLQTIISDSEEHPLASSRAVPQGRPSVDSGLGGHFRWTSTQDHQ